MKKPKAVIDTNVFVAALLGSQPATSVYRAFKQGSFILLISKRLFSELEDVLSRPKLGINPDDKIELLLAVSLGAEIKEVTVEVGDCRDPKDNVVLACAIELEASCIVTCDHDLLSLNPYRHNIRIISPTKFLSEL